MSPGLTAGALHEAASAATGLDDFGDLAADDYRIGLEVLLDSLRDEAQLTPAGAQDIQRVLTGALVGRLTSEAGWRSNPEAAEVAVRQPIFVTGLPRSGTTAIHRLLAADPAHQALEMWLGISPQPRPPLAEWPANPVFAALDDRLRAGRQGTTQGRAMHYLSAELPDECHLLTAQSFLANSFPSMAHVPGYVAWLGEQDWGPAMWRHRLNLQLIGSTSPERRWILKNPGHLAAIDGIFAAYPDAIVVHMRRSPREAIASVASVIQFYQGHTSPQQNGAALGRFQLDMLARDVGAFQHSRAGHDPGQFIDVDYTDFVADPVGTVEGIYRRFSLPWNEHVQLALEAEHRVSTSGERAPRHSYSLDDFGLTPEQVDERFAGYFPG